MLVQLMIYAIQNIYGYYYGNPTTYIVAFCKFRLYLNQITSFTFRWAYTAASVDRYILSSPHARLRRLANVRIAYRVIGLIIIIWSMSTAYTPFAFDIKGGVCGIFSNSFLQVYAPIFTLVAGSFLPIIIMIIFTFLIRKNLTEKTTKSLRSW